MADEPRSKCTGLRELGYIEGQNIVLEVRYSENLPHRLVDLAAELVRLQVDVLVVHGGEGVRAAHHCDGRMDDADMRRLWPPCPPIIIITGLSFQREN